MKTLIDSQIFLAKYVPYKNTVLRKPRSIKLSQKFESSGPKILGISVYGHRKSAEKRCRNVFPALNTKKELIVSIP